MSKSYYNLNVLKEANPELYEQLKPPTGTEIILTSVVIILLLLSAAYCEKQINAKSKIVSTLHYHIKVGNKTYTARKHRYWPPYKQLTLTGDAGEEAVIGMIGGGKFNRKTISYDLYSHRNPECNIMDLSGKAKVPK